MMAESVVSKEPPVRKRKAKKKNAVEPLQKHSNLEVFEFISVKHEEDSGRECGLMLSQLRNIGETVLQERDILTEAVNMETEEGSIASWENPENIILKEEPEEITIEEHNVRDEFILGNLFDDETLAEPLQYNGKKDSTASCAICGRAFKHKRYLKQHALIHAVRMRYKCPKCSRCFTRALHLKSHLETHDRNRPMHPCHICDKKFTRTENLKQHILIHTGEKPHKCGTCGRSFRRIRNMRQHVLTHILTPEGKPHICEYCKKRFARPEHLKQHIVTVHKGLRPYPCPTCGKCFSQLQSMKRHQLTTHSGIRPCECPQCGKCFTHTGDLKRHSSVHSGEKRHCCNLCGKRFSRPEHLRLHLKTHSHDKAYDCSICHKGFKYIRSLKRHALLHMNNSERLPQDASAKNGVAIETVLSTESSEKQEFVNALSLTMSDNLQNGAQVNANQGIMKTLPIS